jgi:hypothetical protein
MLNRMFKPSMKDATVNTKINEVRNKGFYALMNLAVFLHCETGFIRAKQ